jgi:hypothetical protein
MWPSGWKRHRIPYRGEPQPKFAKRRKQFRNLRNEKRENITTILVIVIIMAVIFGCIIFNPSNANPNKLRQGIIVFIFTLVLIASIVAGISSVSKFRKDYDIDTSPELEKANDRQSEDSND